MGADWRCRCVQSEHADMLWNLISAHVYRFCVEIVFAIPFRQRRKKGTRRQRALPTSCNRCPFRPFSNDFQFSYARLCPYNGLFNSNALTPLWQFPNISMSTDVTILGRCEGCCSQFKCEVANNVHLHNSIDWPKQILWKFDVSHLADDTLHRTNSIQLWFQFQIYECFVCILLSTLFGHKLSFKICICAHITANLLLLVSHPVRKLIARNRKITHVFGYIFVPKRWISIFHLHRHGCHTIYVSDVRARSQSAQMAKWQMAHC